MKSFGINEKDQHQYQKIREKINNLIPIAQRAAVIAQVSTLIMGPERAFNNPLEYEKKEYDLFTHYDLLMSKDGPSAHIFEMTMDILDQIIGHFKELKFRKLINLLNPLHLIAIILRIPITILEYMGFSTSSPIVEKIINAIWIFILAVILVKFGERSETVRTFFKLLFPN